MSAVLTIKTYRTITRVKTCTRTNNITGVTATKFSFNTLDGAGLLEFGVTAGFPPTAQQLRYQAPGDTPGAWVPILASRTYILCSANSIYTLQVLVTFTTLPLTAKNDALTIYDLFEPPVRPASGADRLLRSMQGTGLATEHNPLGLSSDDIGGGEEATGLEEHRKLQHDAGIVGIPTCLQAAIFSPGGGDYVSVITPAGADRFFVLGKEYSAIQSSEHPHLPAEINTMMFDDYDGENMLLWEIGLNSFGGLIRNMRLQVQDRVTGHLPNISGVLPLRLKLATEALVSLVLTYNAEARSLQLGDGIGNNGEMVFIDQVLPGAIDGTITLPGPNLGDELTVYIDNSALPVTGLSDIWTVMNLALDTNANCVVCTVVSWSSQLFGEGTNWLTSGGLLYEDLTATPPSTGACDRRAFGTTGEKDLNRSAREYIDNTPVTEDRIEDDAVAPAKLQIMLPSPFGKKLFGSGAMYGQTDGRDVIYTGAQDFGATRVVGYRNLILGPSASLTGNGPFLIVLVYGTLIISAGALISLVGVNGGDASYNTPGVGGVGKGGDGGIGGFSSTPEGRGGLALASGVVYNRFCQGGGPGGGATPGVAGLGTAYMMAGGGGGGGGSSGSYAGGGGAAGGGGVAGPYGSGGAGGADSAGAAGDGYSWYNKTMQFMGVDGMAFRYIALGGQKGWGGGGGGGAYVYNDHNCAGGGGGGGGGAIYIEARNIIFEGNFSGKLAFDVHGGDGGMGFGSDSGAGGADGGGGGGTVCIICEKSFGKATADMFDLMDVDGGAKGLQTNTSGNHRSYGGKGGDGGAGCGVVLNMADLP